jgi:putative transposase
VEVSEPVRKPKPVKYATADIGAKRTIAVAIQGSRIAYVFSARQLWKDYKYWTRRIAREQSRLSQQGLKTSRQLKRLYRLRRLRLRHALEAMAKRVTDTLKKHGVTHFKVGYPKDCRESMDFGANNEKVHNFWNFRTVLDILEKHCRRRGIEFERVDEAGTSEVCHICGSTMKRPVRSEVICPVHSRTHADVNAALNILRKETPVYGDGLEASLVWVTHEWNKHSWVPRTKSLSYLSQVLGLVA